MLATLQFSRPTAVITPLLAEVHDLAFPVRWGDVSSVDAKTFDICVSDDGGTRKIWLARTPLTGATFTGTGDHRYSFTAVAIDESGVRSALNAQAITLVRTRARSSTSVQPSADQVVAGQPVSFTATVTTPDAAWSGAPSGAVRFFVDAQPLGGPVPLDGFGVAASPPVTTLPAGPHQVAASYLAAGAYQMQVTSSASGVVRDRSGQPLIGGNVVFSLRV